MDDHHADREAERTRAARSWRTEMFVILLVLSAFGTLVALAHS